MDPDDDQAPLRRWKLALLRGAIAGGAVALVFGALLLVAAFLLEGPRTAWSLAAPFVPAAIVGAATAVAAAVELGAARGRRTRARDAVAATFAGLAAAAAILAGSAQLAYAFALLEGRSPLDALPATLASLAELAGERPSHRSAPTWWAIALLAEGFAAATFVRLREPTTAIHGRAMGATAIIGTITLVVLCLLANTWPEPLLLAVIQIPAVLVAGLLPVAAAVADRRLSA